MGVVVGTMAVGGNVGVNDRWLWPTVGDGGGANITARNRGSQGTVTWPHGHQHLRLFNESVYNASLSDNVQLTCSP